MLSSQTLTACDSLTFQPAVRSLPAVADVIPPPAPRPRPKVGQDLGIIAGQWRATALENAERLGVARTNYEAVAAAYAGAKE